MGTRFAPTFVSPPAGVPPFLLTKSQGRGRDSVFEDALQAALAAERADGAQPHVRGRIAYLLCGLGVELTRRRAERDGDLPLSRTRLAAALGTNLCRVKRTLAMLALSGVIETDGQSIRVLDWPRLASIANYDLDRLELSAEEMDGETVLIIGEKAVTNTCTVAGDPACFV